MSERAVTKLRTLVVVLCGIWLIVLAVAIAMRIVFPLELEWMEGGALHQALRLQRGQPIYGAPSADYVPFLYTPFYSLVLAVLGTIFPVDYMLGRSTSVVAAILAAVAAFWAVRHEGKPSAHAWAAVGMFFSAYVFTFRWLDLARADAMFLALVGWGLLLLRRSAGSHRRAIAAGVLIALAFWTKQTAALFVVASGIAVLLVAPRQAVSYVTTVAIIDGLGVLIGDAWTHGWLWTYIYELHQQHAFNHERFTTKTWGMFIHAAPFLTMLLVGLAVDSAVRIVRRGRAHVAGATEWLARLARHRGRVYWGLMAATGLLASALGYATQWAEPNAFLPGVYFAAIFIAVVVPMEGKREAAALALVCTQLVFALVIEPRYQPIQDRGLAGIASSYAVSTPHRTIPDRDAYRRAADLRTHLESMTGGVLALHRPWWNVLGGGFGHVGMMALHDVTKVDRSAIQEAIVGRVRAGHFREIWLEGEPPDWLRRELVQGWRIERRLHGEARVRPMTGFMSEAGMVTSYDRDQLAFVLESPRTVPPKTTVVADFEDRTFSGWVIEGAAFGDRPVAGLHGRLPAVGPYGGAWLLSSAGPGGRLAGRGTALSPLFRVPRGGLLQMLVGASGDSSRLGIEIVDEQSVLLATMKVGAETPWLLETARLAPGEAWADRPVRLRIFDHDPQGALFVDDVWITVAP